LPGAAEANVHRNRWQLGALACHALLLVALASHIMGGERSPTRALLTVAAVTPLLLVLRGLVLGRRVALQRLAVLLVPYLGALSVEVVASPGRAAWLNAALLAAAIELGIVLGLSRRSSSAAPRARE
jgi:Predicted membrane protein (DUF2069)